VFRTGVFERRRHGDNERTETDFWHREHRAPTLRSPSDPLSEMPLSVYSLPAATNGVSCRGAPLRTPVPRVGSELARGRLGSGPEYSNHGDTEATEIQAFDTEGHRAPTQRSQSKAASRSCAARRGAPACFAASIRLCRMLFGFEDTESGREGSDFSRRPRRTQRFGRGDDERLVRFM
jgi:hypothetical protein